MSTMHIFSILIFAPEGITLLCIFHLRQYGSRAHRRGSEPHSAASVRDGGEDSRSTKPTALSARGNRVLGAWRGERSEQEEFLPLATVRSASEASPTDRVSGVIPSGVDDQMTSTETPPSFQTFHVLSRLDLKVAAGSFSKKWKLGEGPRCAPVAFARLPASASSHVVCNAPLPLHRER